MVRLRVPVSLVPVLCPEVGRQICYTILPLSWTEQCYWVCIWLAQGPRSMRQLGRGGGSYWNPLLEPLGEPLSASLKYSLNTIDLISQYIISLTITINFWWESDRICQYGASSPFYIDSASLLCIKGVGQLFHNYSPVSDPHSESIRDSRPKIQTYTKKLQRHRRLEYPSKIVFRTE